MSGDERIAWLSMTPEERRVSNMKIPQPGREHRCKNCRYWPEIMVRAQEVWHPFPVPENQMVYCDVKGAWVQPMSFCNEGEWE